jgi:hypothetical protein
MGFEDPSQPSGILPGMGESLEEEAAKGGFEQPDNLSPRYPPPGAPGVFVGTSCDYYSA